MLKEAIIISLAGGLVSGITFFAVSKTGILGDLQNNPMPHVIFATVANIGGVYVALKYFV